MIAHIGIVLDDNTQPFGRRVVGVHESFAASQKKSIGPGQMKGTAHGRLELAPVLLHPCADIVRRTDGNARQIFIGFPAGHTKQVFPELVLLVGPGQNGVCPVMKIAKIAGMPAVAAPKLPGRAFQHQYGRTRLPGGHGGA